MALNTQFRFIKWIVVILLLSPIFYLTYRGYTNSIGYCHHDKKNLTETEKLQKVITHIISQKTINITGNDKRSTGFFPVIQYKSNEEFLEKNPNCCFVGLNNIQKEKWTGIDGIRMPSPLDKFFGAYNEAIGVKYSIQYIDEKGETHTAHKEQVYIIQNCGHVGI